MTSLKLFLAILILCISSFSVVGQGQIKNYVRNNTVQISTIDPMATGYSDLQTIGSAIGNASIVMIGEQDHGDAPTYLAKTRLIKYLHETKGFDVLAFESDFFSLNEGWDRLNKDKSQIETFLRSNIYPVWTYCDACSTLFYQYIPSTYLSDHPLEITGFDSDLVLNYAASNLISHLDSVLRVLKLPIVDNERYKTRILPLLDSLKFAFSSTLDTSFYTRSQFCLQAIRTEMSNKIPVNDFWIQVVNNLISANRNYQMRDANIIESFNARDSQMANNLNWLARTKFSGKKIIVWAANTHIGKSKDTVMKNRNDEGFTSMGYYFTQDTSVLKTTYALGFSSLRGQAGRLTMTAPTPNIFESWVDTAYLYAFIDFRSYRQKHAGDEESFYLKGFTHFPEKENWTRVFDGIFYIKDMYPCRK